MSNAKIPSKTAKTPSDYEPPLSADLLSSRNALREVELYFGGSVNAKAMLAEKIKDGEIKAYAKYAWKTSNLNIKQEWRNSPPPEAEIKVRISKGVLSGSSVFDQDVRRWKWGKGRFYITHHKKNDEIVRYFYRAVYFDKAEILQLVERAKNALRATGKGGRKFNEEAWGTLWLQIVKLGQAQQLNKDRFPEEHVFLNDVLKLYKRAPEGTQKLADNTVDQQLKRAYEILIENGPVDPELLKI